MSPRPGPGFVGFGMGRGMGLGRMRFEDSKQRPQISKEILIRILKYLVPYWKQQIIILLCLLAISGLDLIPPIITKNIIDVAIKNKDMALLGFLTLASIAATILSGLISVGQNYVTTWMSKHIILDVRNQMYRHLQYMSLKFFSNEKTGEIISRLNNDIHGIEGIISGTLVNIVYNLFSLVLTLTALFSMNWKLAILGTFLVPFFVLPTRQVGKMRWRLASETHQKMAEMNQHIQETLGISGVILTKIFTREEAEIKKFHDINLEVIKLQIRENMVGRWFFMLLRTISVLGPSIIYFVGGYLVIKDELTVGTVVTFVTLLTRLYGPVSHLSNLHVDITRSFALFERIFDYLDREPDIKDLPEAVELPPISGKIEFDHVYFSYDGENPTLEDITFSVEPGQMIAIVGPTGAGKTTIAYLVPRLYEPTSGRILIDGRDIRTVTLKSLRSQIGMVTQDPYLFNATIRENILYGKPDATEEEMIAACKAAQIHDFISSLPEGYDTVVGERGIKLSGGEKQRIAIARVLLSNPRIIILDEATSSLDSHTEALIQKALEALLSGRTSIVIAHRLSTILAAHRILVIDNGRIVESGTHHELLKNNGLYSILYREQFKPQLTGLTDSYLA
ncbi:MAG: ABC transporter ATP-binding protein [Caldicoprobacter sp.]|uniref:ABC transporter ATP-binding protein n=1 Tax=Caldicoprobacter sp. TaxID=2004500 RepID=UPI0039C0C798